MTVKAAHYNIKKTTSDAGAFHVLQVVTIPEASELFGISEGKVRRALERVAYRRTETGTTLVSLPAMKEIFGEPAEMPEIFWILPIG